MARDDQPEPSAGQSQLDMFGAEALPAYRPDPDKVRARLHLILNEARAARTLPWEPTRLSLYRTIFPPMANWLPAEEADELRAAFAAELARLEAA